MRRLWDQFWDSISILRSLADTVFGREEQERGLSFGEAVGENAWGGCGCTLLLLVVLILTPLIVLLNLGSEEDREALQSVDIEGGVVDPEPGSFPDLVDANGWVLPHEGEWQLYNEQGTATCEDGVDEERQQSVLEANSRTGYLWVLDGGERIAVSLIEPGEPPPSQSDALILERTSASPEQAVYFGDVGEQMGLGSNINTMQLTFSSSSTLGGKIEGCADRGGDGYLIEPAND